MISRTNKYDVIYTQKTYLRITSSNIDDVISDWQQHIDSISIPSFVVRHHALYHSYTDFLVNLTLGSFVVSEI